MEQYMTKIEIGKLEYHCSLQNYIPLRAAVNGYVEGQSPLYRKMIISYKLWVNGYIKSLKLGI